MFNTAVDCRIPHNIREVKLYSRRFDITPEFRRSGAITLISPHNQHRTACIRKLHLFLRLLKTLLVEGFGVRSVHQRQDDRQCFIRFPLANLNQRFVPIFPSVEIDSVLRSRLTSIFQASGRETCMSEALLDQKRRRASDPL